MAVKQKLLHLMQLLLDLSDESHPLDSTELISLLSLRGVDAERKAIYRDIDALRDYGLDIVKCTRGYYVASRTFQIAEVTLMRDAIVSANFITPKKTRDLLEKLKTLLSVHDAERLERATSGDNPQKSLNEDVFSSIDQISRAIDSHLRISLCYSKLSLGGENNLRYHEVSPYALAWVEGKYYLIGNIEKYDDTAHFRLDRISEVVLLDKSARDFSQVSPYREAFDTADYVKHHINMVAGNPEKVSFRCSNSIYNKVVDKFGRSFAFARKSDAFVLTADVAIGPGLIAWISQFGPDIEVLSPQTLRDALRERFLCAASRYQSNPPEPTEEG